MTRPQGAPTHTVAELEVSAAAFTEIAGALRKADYDHAFMPCGMIDMSGIGITASSAMPVTACDCDGPCRLAFEGALPGAVRCARWPTSVRSDGGLVRRANPLFDAPIEEMAAYDPRSPLTPDWDAAFARCGSSPQRDHEAYERDAADEYRDSQEREPSQETARWIGWLLIAISMLIVGAGVAHVATVVGRYYGFW